MKVLKYLNGLPGIILAVLALAGVFRLYVHQKEVAAVAQADLKRVIAEHRTADSVRIFRTDSLVHAWQDSTSRLRQRERASRAEAVAADIGRQAFHDQLHQLVDTMDARVKAAVDSLEASHARQVLSLTEALARADSVIQGDSATIMQLRSNLHDFQRSNVELIGQLDAARKRLNPGIGHQLVGMAPWLIASAAIGYMAHR